MLHEKRLCYTRRRSTDSLKASSARDLFSTAEEFLSTNEEIAHKLNKEEITKAAASEAYGRYEEALWVELKRLYEPDKEDALWKLQRYMHDPLT
ncbi:hypothetical protein Tco_0067774 [Tanacetum coccineum]